VVDPVIARSMAERVVGVCDTPTRVRTAFELVPGTAMTATVQQNLAAELSRLSAYVAQCAPLADGVHLLARAQTLVDDLQRSLGESRGFTLLRPPPLAVESFGHFRLTRGGVALTPLPAQKAIAVFRFLLTRPERAAHKEELADALWSGAATKDAMHSLHVAVSTLRGHLNRGPEQYVLFEAGRYAVSPSAQVIDETKEFLAAIERGNDFYRAGHEGEAALTYDQALTCYRGDFCIENLDYVWAAEERERLLSTYLTALYRVGRIRLRQRRYEDAIDVLRPLSIRECYREDVHYQLMLCYLHLGRRSDAIRQFELCERHLASDLSIAPAPRLQSLYQLVTTGGDARTNMRDDLQSACSTFSNTATPGDSSGSDIATG
jgi:DNA-binding SARP family transcriptional activator